MADQDLSITAPSIARSSSIATIGKSWSAVGPTASAGCDLPIPLSSGRGYGPQIPLSINSQSGNGPFGLGCNLGLSQISRRTNKGVPRYTEHDEIIGHDGEVWMPELDDDGNLKWRSENSYRGVSVAEHNVLSYRARIESDFSLRECWHPADGGRPFWLVHGADGTLHVYGKTAAARRADPDDESRISSWLLCESMNAHGEHICYEYKPDDQPDEQDPTHDYRAQRYLRRVCYGNATASDRLYSWDFDRPTDLPWHFQLLFDYGERSNSLSEVPTYDEANRWQLRPDPFSSYGQGFELSTRRLCQQVLMFHHFPEGLATEAKLARRLLLEYRPIQNTGQWTYSQISAAHYQAFDAKGQVEHSPPMEFEYSPFQINKTPARLLENQTQPGIEDGGFYQCVDLYGEGVPGFLCRYDNAWYYREPLRAAPGTDLIGYGPWALLDKIPVADRNRAVAQLIDLTGDGRLDLIIARLGYCGFHALNAQRQFELFSAFDKFPREHQDLALIMGDFSGDGLMSAASISPNLVRLYASLREKGFAAAQEIPHEYAGDRLPVFSNSPTELVLLGNLLGSDMPELCRIRHDEVRCWPNLGHGKFGKGRKISALPFTYEEFDASRVRLADLDGSGAPALIYLKSEGFDIYLNRGGNGLEQIPVSVPWPEKVRYDRLCQVSFADLQGLGCASLILTVPHIQPRHWRYDFVAAKPYLLVNSNNNMGCSCSVTYRSSAQEWLDEKERLLALERAPVCHLPFPLAVVKKQEQHDEITDNRLTQSFIWREGFYDGREREFRGFGYLQQLDCEVGTDPSEPGFSEPVQTCTWFHNGEEINRSRDDYFSADVGACPLGETLFSRYHPKGEIDEPVTPEDADSRYRVAQALVGSVARTEIFPYRADAQAPGAAAPYSVEEKRYLVREVRPQGQYAAAVLLPLQVEAISYQYDGFIDDPLCRHDVTLRWDAYGAATHALTVSYARRLTAQSPPPFTEDHLNQWWSDAHDDAQQYFYISETRARLINLPEPQQWRLGLPYLERGDALKFAKGTLPGELNPSQVSFESLRKLQDSQEWAIERVLTSQSIQRYVDVEGIELDDGVAGFEALSHSLELALLDKTALDAYSIVPDVNIREALAAIGYDPMQLLFEAPPSEEQNLWSSRFNLARYGGLQAFYKVLDFNETPSHGVTKAEYDQHYLAVMRMELPDECAVEVAEFDYHALKPRLIKDANDNFEEVIYEPSGQPLVVSFYGTENGEPAGFEKLGDGWTLPDTSPEYAIQFPEDTVGKAASTLHKNPFSWMGSIPSSTLRNRSIMQGDLLPGGQIRASARRRLAQSHALTPEDQQLIEAIELAYREPVHTVVLSADRYPTDPVVAQIQIVKTCVDGFGRVLQTQQKVDPGLAYVVGEHGELLIEEGEQPTQTRWRISERVEYNNKGLPIRQFRAFFANTHRYVNDQSLRKLGLFDQLFYDAPGRLVTLVNAKGYFSRETYHPWYHTSEDCNDTAEEVVPSSESGA
ncbi:toxin [Pseudomonas moraviensis subsp. stanleyae]|uniref:SpvB/TcaC N-terminal domain-containing protein n=1 Tax=Pseudomonas moraviensis TaxID=321662 RepID=UPI002E3646A7|nr:SpvB/TcaC N-terminal domain-containing protein [Pseudomonas moraviensis]MED7667144.1 toxin [Pseudomonas moraviensis subsp. stanleyae]